MPNDLPAKTLTFRVSQEEIEHLESLRSRLQDRAATGVRVTQRMTVLAALERLQAHLDKLDREQSKKR